MFPAVVRIYTKARLPYFHDWESRHSDPFFAQGAGASPSDPVWRMAVRAEAARGQGKVAAAAAFDVAPFWIPLIGDSSLREQSTQAWSLS